MNEYWIYHRHQAHSSIALEKKINKVKTKKKIRTHTTGKTREMVNNFKSFYFYMCPHYYLWKLEITFDSRNKFASKFANSCYQFTSLPFTSLPHQNFVSTENYMNHERWALCIEQYEQH